MKVVVCGAGIAGLALARRLAELDADVVVLEKAPAPRTQGYMIDFFGPGYDAADAMGVLPRLRELGYRVSEAAWFGQNGRRRAGLGYARFEEALGGRLLSIMRPDLELALRESLPERVEVRFGARLTGLEQDPDGVRVTLADDTAVEADLLVGADGIHSTVRRLTFGTAADQLRYLGFHTAAFVFSDPEAHRRVTGRFCLTDTIDRQLGFYGLRDGRVAAFAVHRESDPALPAHPRQALREIYSGLGWVVPRALAACPPDEQIYYDQVAQVVVPHWSEGRVTLVGDAAYAVSLLAGQGATLAVAGAYVLADQLVQADTVPLGLARYERLWRPVAEEKQRAGRRGARWFLPSSRGELLVRRLALRASRLPGVSQGLAGLLAGKPVGLIDQLRSTPRDARRTARG
ncbi:FAD-dependent oxidoreductase [Actinomadura harenae]|uniref:FAD-dependent oxidoreductase n=1 Tax=Actinomadura harenae TaxID=2483351 RepID=A0A3M2M369_9ACTN|nr:FAD-dependent oxidoreductase [Actinomadura harenae]RMI44057.1 FAD-dependent oxidoreductase [Actinomadura harenae]